MPTLEWIGKSKVVNHHLDVPYYTLDLGRKWQDLSGPKFRYFMVFRNKDLGLEDAYTLDYFTEIMKEI